MEAIETLAAGWIAEHPEWHADFADAEAAVARVYTDGLQQLLSGQATLDQVLCTSPCGTRLLPGASGVRRMARSTSPACSGAPRATDGCR